jgi:murein hydrolase activator
MQKNLLILAAALIATSATCSTVLGESPDVGRVKQNAESTQQELQLSAARQRQLANEVGIALAAEKAATEKLLAAATNIESREAALTATEKRIDTLEAEATTIRAAFADKQEVLSELLAGLQRLEQNPPPALVVAPHDIVDALRGAMMFGAVVPAMRDEAALLLNKLERLAAITSEAANHKQDATAQLASLNASYRELENLLAEKRRIVSSTEAELDAESKRSEGLARQAKNLGQLLAALEAEQRAIEAKRTAESTAREKERARQQALLDQKPMRLSLALGRLEYPAQGDILQRFGSDTGLGGSSEGIAIATRTSSQVRSPVSGKVEFAGPFRSYGQLLILNAGEGYLVLLAGMNEISVTLGQAIVAGEPVGLMGDHPSSMALVGAESGEKRPVLYVEFRKNGEPVDSQPWWVGGRKEARQ